MSKSKDWWPDGRQDQLNLMRKWMSVFTEDSKVQPGKPNWKVWGFDEETFRAFGNALAEAETSYDALLLSGSRGGPLGAAATIKLNALEKMARNMRRRLFFSPPIPPEYMVLLEYRERDTSRTPPQVPVRTVSVQASNPELHTVMLSLGPGGGGNQDVSGFSYNVRAGILVPDGKFPERSPNTAYYITKVPLIPEDLPKQFNKSRKHESWGFSGLEAGMTAHFAIAYENSKGETGPWVMVQAIIT